MHQKIEARFVAITMEVAVVIAYSISSAQSNAQDETVATDFVQQRLGQSRILPTSRVRHRGDEPRDDGLDRVRRPTRR
jgi:hypothetical protein